MRTYLTRAGDTLSGIARLVGVDWRTLARVNHLDRPDRLPVGIRLRIPGHGHSESRAAGGAPTVPAPEAAAGGLETHLGDLSMLYETGHAPGQELQASGVVSSGRNDPGGVSYGAYQLASRSHHGTPTIWVFLAREGLQWAPEFGQDDPTMHDGPFGTCWKTIAKRDGLVFFHGQHDFIARSHFLPVVNYVKKHTGLDIRARSITLQNVVWSMAVQHGEAAHLVVLAVSSVFGETSEPSLRLPSQPLNLGEAGLDAIYRNALWARENTAMDRTLILKLYEVRRAYVVKHGLSHLLGRYTQEERDALKALGSP